MNAISVGNAIGYNIDPVTGEYIESHNDTTFEQRETELKQAEEQQAEELKREKGSPYRTWAQLNLQYSKEMMWLIGANPRAAQILIFLIEHMDGYNALVCSAKLLQEALGCSQATITRAIKMLKDNGFVKIAKSGSTNVYYVNGDLVWKSWGTNFKYAEFTAKILIAESEQEKQTAPIKTKKMATAIIKEPQGDKTQP